MKRKLKITNNAPVVLGFIGICFLVTILGELSHGRITQLLFMTYHSSLLSPFTWIRFVTHIFGHSGWEHFIGNASYILLLGPMLEEKYGSKELIRIILITAVSTALFHYFVFPQIALCGASGVVFALILLSSFTEFKQGEIPLTFIVVATIYIGAQIYQGIAYQDNISNMAHILGGICGAVSGYYLNQR